MCAAALLRCGIKAVVFGCGNDKFGGCGSVVDVLESSGMHVTRGVKAGEAIALLQSFYRTNNEHKARAVAVATRTAGDSM